MQGHDKRADRYLVAIEGTQSIADKLMSKGFAPATGKSLRDSVLKADPTYEECGLETNEGFACRVIGKGVGMRKHRADEKQHKMLV